MKLEMCTAQTYEVFETVFYLGERIKVKGERFSKRPGLSPFTFQLLPHFSPLRIFPKNCIDPHLDDADEGFPEDAGRHF
jgi:hypothetical protein